MHKGTYHVTPRQILCASTGTQAWKRGTSQMSSTSKEMEKMHDSANEQPAFGRSLSAHYRCRHYRGHAESHPALESMLVRTQRAQLARGLSIRARRPSQKGSIWGGRELRPDSQESMCAVDLSKIDSPETAIIDKANGHSCRRPLHKRPGPKHGRLMRL